MKVSISGSNITSHNSRSSAPPPTRTKNKGWTKHAAIRNRNFLYQVVPEALSGWGYGVTLTVKDCPTPETWAKWRYLYFKYLKARFGLTRYHCVTEWQRRGMPHLHAAVWFGGEAVDPNRRVVVPSPHELVEVWLKISSEGSPSIAAQDIKPMKNAFHWLRYLAKHGARGVSNYQRHPDNIPRSWQGKTGRVWGKGGDWPLMPFFKVEGLSQVDKYRVRRMFCRYLASNPRHLKIKDDAAVRTRKYWQSYLRCNDAKKSRFKSPSSFIPIEVTTKIIKQVQPEAIFVTEDGEFFDEVSHMRPPAWVPPVTVPADMSDIMRPLTA